MKAYKATYNMKCETLTYEVGETYSITSMEMCKHGFHFCKEMKDVLVYYSYNENFVLMEVEILGTVEVEGTKGVTDKMRVVRIVPKEEYTFSVPVCEYDERNNMISKTYPDGGKSTWEYDERNNRISETLPDGTAWRITIE